MTNISIIIPVFTGHENLKYLLPAINQQTLLPCEIVIVDSCSHTEVKELIDYIHVVISQVKLVCSMNKKRILVLCPHPENCTPWATIKI